MDIANTATPRGTPLSGATRVQVRRLKHFQLVDGGALARGWIVWRTIHPVVSRCRDSAAVEER
jgi:hypothetical protein